MGGPAPAVAAARSAVRTSLADLARERPGALVLVACSGGPDSLALAAATAFVAPRLDLRAGAVVIDHGLQVGSDVVARRAAAACVDLGLGPAEVVRVHVGPTGDGPEAAARRARHDALTAVAAAHDAVALLLGHTLDDQAETVLIRLARGSGARSLAGIAPRADLLRRPLLALTREQTAAACAAQGLSPWHDPHNDDPALTRNRVRHGALPALAAALGPGVAEALARTADLLRADADALDALAADLLRAASLGPAVLDVAVLTGAPAALRHRALRSAAVAAGAPAGSLNRGHVLEIDALVTRWHGQGPLHLPGGVAARRSCGRLTLG